VTSAVDIKRLLVDTTMPGPVVDELVAAASALWFMSAPAPLLARDLVLCHPPLREGEIRAVAQPLDEKSLRLTVVAQDRKGLLADTAAVLAAEKLSIAAASAVTWTELGLALHALTITSSALSPDRWDDLGVRLRALGTGERPTVDFAPGGPAVVSGSPSGMGRCVVKVTAPDQIGLLWAICQWLADQGASIEAAHVGGTNGEACDHFVVIGEPDLTGLAARLTGRDQSLPARVRHTTGDALDALARVVRRLLPG
jgi:predicted amino acid-binding ACT domain protein